jgi:hypothetical protein
VTPAVARAILAIRAVPWRGIELVRPPDDETSEPRRGRRGPTAAPRPLGETSTKLYAWLRANPGEHRTRVLADAVGENSRRICAAMETLVGRGLVARRPAGKADDQGRPGMVYRALGLALVVGLLSSPAASHGWYSGLTQPGNPGVPCCSDQDCYGTDECRLPNGNEGVMSRRFGCQSIPWSKVLGISSPDGKVSLCESPYTTEFHPYCVILPGEASLSRPDRTLAEARP